MDMKRGSGVDAGLASTLLGGACREDKPGPPSKWGSEVDAGSASTLLGGACRENVSDCQINGYERGL